MQFLIDTSPNKMQTLIERPLVLGQLLTPLTRYSNAGGVFAIDNGAFSGFDREAFKSLLKREEDRRSDCLFVTVPDIVGSARRTLEIFGMKHTFGFLANWRVALVAQDGLEELPVPWHAIDCLFIGGRDPWKDSQSSLDLVRTAKTLGKHVHVGRVNTAKRFKLFREAGADTCDGSGIAMYEHMLSDIEKALDKKTEPTLWDSIEVA